LQPPAEVKARIKAILSFVKSLLLVIKEENNYVITQCCGSVTLAGSGSAMTLKVGCGSAIINNPRSGLPQEKNSKKRSFCFENEIYFDIE